MTPIDISILGSAALYGVVFFAYAAYCAYRTPPDIGVPAPPPVKPPPPLQGASVLAVPFDPATARALALLAENHPDLDGVQIVRRRVRVQALAEMGQ